jgi:chromosome segregation ATPase
MAAGVTNDEFDHLKVRVDVVEREVEGEKTVTRHILEQTRHNGDDLAAVKSRLDRHDQRFDSLERRFDGLERRFDGLERKFGGLERQMDGLRKDLPKIVGDVMRDVLQERDNKR